MALREMGGHWKHDVYVDRTTMKVVHIGPNPPPNTTNNANVQQIDHVCMAEIRRDVYHELTVGNVWDISKVASLHDLMASVKSWLEGKQLDRLAGGKGSGKLFTTVPEELYRKGKWVPNPSSQDLHRMFGFIGLAVSARIIALQMEVMADYWSVGEQLAKIRKREQPSYADGKTWYALDSLNTTQKKHDYDELAGRTVSFLSHFVEDDEPLQKWRAVNTYALWLEVVKPGL